MVWLENPDWIFPQSKAENCMFVLYIFLMCFYSTFILFYYNSGKKKKKKNSRGTLSRDYQSRFYVCVCFFVSFFNLFISGSPSISVCHVSSAGSGWGRLLLHAWVWEEEDPPPLSPPLPLAQTHMNDSLRFVFVWKTLTQWHKFVPESALKAAEAFLPTAESLSSTTLCVCVCGHVCVADLAWWHELGLRLLFFSPFFFFFSFCQGSRMWNGSGLRDQNKAREHDRKSLNTRPLKNAGGRRTQKQVR